MSFLDQGVSCFLAQLKPDSLPISDRRLNLLGIETFLSLKDCTRLVPGNCMTTPHLLLAEHIFVKFNARTGQWQAINATIGITRPVTFGKESVAVPLLTVG